MYRKVVLWTALCTAVVALASATAMAQSRELCSSCAAYAPLIEEAVERGEWRVLQLLRGEIVRTDLSAEEKGHLAQSISNAESSILRSAAAPVATTRDVKEVNERASASDVFGASDDTDFTARIANASVRGQRQKSTGGDGAESAAVMEETEFSAAHVNASVRNGPVADQPIAPTSIASEVEAASGVEVLDVEAAYRSAGYSLDSSPAFDNFDNQAFGDGINQFDVEAAYRAAGYALDTAPEATLGDNTTVVLHDKEANVEVGDVLAADNTSDFDLPNGAEQLFSSSYRRIRQRYLDYFFFDGMSATALVLKDGSDPTQLSKASVKTAEFADQTLHMGQALLTFAAESSLLKQKGLDNSPSEAIVKNLLDAFDDLDNADGLPGIYGVSKAGFFLRDFIHRNKRRGVPTDWEISSDSQIMLDGGPRHQAAMSLDQAASLFIGWWAVSKYSTSQGNRTTARQQCDRVISYLKDSLYFIKLPTGDSIPSNRGPEFRYAAGFLCRMAEATTGKTYYDSSSIDVTVKGDPIRFRDDNLGEFEIPGYKIPATMRVSLSHPLVVGLKPAALAVMTTPRIKVRFSDLFPGADPNMDLPCAHMVQAHPSGHTNMVPCVHLTVKHSGGDLVATLPCAHMVKKHPGGDRVPCVHMTAAHPGGHDGPTLPCAHLGKLHGSHTKRIAGVRVRVPCTHIGPKHPGGHKQTIPCVHLTAKHPGGHSVPCVHLTAKHPAGHKQFAPCIHPTAVHPAGDPVNLPCAHFEQAHPSGHGFDLRSLDIDVPLGEKMHPFTRHIVLQCFAFEPAVNGVTEFVPIALSSNHIWSALLRAQVVGDVPVGLLTAEVREALDAMPAGRGPDNKNQKPWTRSNRWERCTELEPSGDKPQVYNGLDYLGLEVLARLNGIQ